MIIDDRIDRSLFCGASNQKKMKQPNISNTSCVAYVLIWLIPILRCWGEATPKSLAEVNSDTVEEEVSISSSIVDGDKALEFLIECFCRGVGFACFLLLKRSIFPFWIIRLTRQRTAFDTQGSTTFFSSNIGAKRPETHFPRETWVRVLLLCGVLRLLCNSDRCIMVIKRGSPRGGAPSRRFCSIYN